MLTLCPRLCREIAELEGLRMERLSLAEAASRNWDVVVAGTSFASMFFGHALPRGLSVLFVEKGGHYPLAAQLASGWAVREDIPQRNSSGHPKDWLAFTLFGGNSNYWWGDTPRQHPDDFRLHSLAGVGMDWPFGYADLEPYYERCEALIEVAGGGSEHILPRRSPLPYPPHVLSRSDVALFASSDLWVPIPTARSNGGSRARCCANGVCGTCPVDAKFTMLNGFERLVHPNARFLLDTEVRALELRDGRAEAVEVRDATGATARLRARVFALGTNAIFNAAILLRSGLSNDALGRYLHEEAAKEILIDTRTMTNYFGGTSETAHGYHFYHGADRAEAAAVLLENVNAPASIRPEIGRWTNRVRLRAVAEDLPKPENRVLLENDAPVIEWTGHHDYALRGLDRAIERLAEVIPDEIEALQVSPVWSSQAHIQGTHRMGPSAEESVVDDRLRLHQAPNVFALGAGAFPTCSPANPSLTIAALSLRAAEVVT
jgi:choline dehydrogenase-like flavoprotein